METIMTIQFIDQDTQSTHLAEYNATKKRKMEKIPSFPRNAQSGWPLLQVSLYTPDFSQGSLKYLPALGGGKCHDFELAAFFFAKMLTELPGKVEASESLKTGNLDAIITFNGGRYEVEHIDNGISVVSKSGGYGYRATEIKVSDGDGHALKNGLLGAHKFASKNKKWGGDFGTFDRGFEPSRTETDLRKLLDPEVAIFHDGQIFVDLGALLDNVVKDDSIKETLATIFKVNEFNSLNLEAPEIEIIESSITIENSDNPDSLIQTSKDELSEHERLAYHSDSLLDKLVTDMDKLSKVDTLYSIKDIEEQLQTTQKIETTSEEVADMPVSSNKSSFFTRESVKRKAKEMVSGIPGFNLLHK
jgi:hypothetical protein